MLAEFKVPSFTKKVTTFVVSSPVLEKLVPRKAVVYVARGADPESVYTPEPAFHAPFRPPSDVQANAS
jgi:hypothetical protein